LPFAVVPLVKFTASREKMGPFATKRLWAILAWLVAGAIIALNARLVIGQISDWAEAAGSLGWLVYATAGPLAVGLAGLLMWMTFRREDTRESTTAVSSETVAATALGKSQQFKRIGVALDASDTDSAMLAEAIALARAHKAELILMHVVEGVGGQWYGHQADDAEYRHDEQYLHDLANRLRQPLQLEGIPDVRAELGFGTVASELVRIARECNVDMMVAGGHGHRGLSDLFKGETISALRHGVTVPVLTVKGAKSVVTGAFPAPPGATAGG
jgi:manganese transport protein